MPKDYFQFKQFLVNQGRSAFKVGTDGVMLGSWASVENAESILDIGTGTGLIALMLAQRTATSPTTNTRIVALEIHKGSCEQAMDNVSISPWKHRITVIKQSFQDFCETGPAMFDLIVSNPPFFSDSRKPDRQEKEISRHDTHLNLGELISGVRILLAPEGKFCVILPAEESKKMQKSGIDKGLFLHRICRVCPTINLPAKRHLLEFQRRPAERVQESEIAIEGDTRHAYTGAYRELTREFYLAF